MAAKRFYYAAAWIAVALVVGGCATTGERPAQARWTRVHDDMYSAPSVAATEDPATTANLEQLIALAMERNPGLRAAFDRWSAELQTVPQENALPDPTLSYGYFVEPIETRVGPQRQRFALRQTIPLSGELGLRGEASVHSAESKAAVFESRQDDLRFRITRLWNDYYYLGRAIQVTENNVRLMTDLEAIALSQYAAGKASHSAVIRAQVELGRLEDQLLTLKDQRVPVLSALNAEINRPATTEIAWPDTVDARPITATVDTLRSALMTHNPMLHALAHEASRETVNAKLAGRSAIPDLTIGAEYIQIDELRDAPNSGKDALIATATINVPLWFGQYKAQKNEAGARRSAVVNEHAQLRNELLAVFEQAHFEFRDAERRIELYLYSLLPRGRQALEVTENAFIAGDVDFLELVDAQRTLLEFELSFARAVADRATKRAHLEHLIGANVD